MRISTKEWRSLTKEQKHYLLVGIAFIQHKKGVYTPFTNMFD